MNKKKILKFLYNRLFDLHNKLVKQNKIISSQNFRECDIIKHEVILNQLKLVIDIIINF